MCSSQFSANLWGFSDILCRYQPDWYFYQVQLINYRLHESNIPYLNLNKTSKLTEIRGNKRQPPNRLLPFCLFFIFIKKNFEFPNDFKKSPTKTLKNKIKFQVFLKCLTLPTIYFNNLLNFKFFIVQFHRIFNYFT